MVLRPNEQRFDSTIQKQGFTVNNYPEHSGESGNREFQHEPVMDQWFFDRKVAKKFLAEPLIRPLVIRSA